MFPPQIVKQWTPYQGWFMSCHKNVLSGGTFSSAAEAVAARQKAQAKIPKRFSKHGRSAS